MFAWHQRMLANPPIEPAPRFELFTVAKGADGVEHKVWGINGKPYLTILPEGIDGVEPLSVILQEGTLAGIHIRKHESELRTAGYESVEQAIWDIATNYTNYKGTKANSIRLVREIALEGDGRLVRGVLQSEFQKVSNAYRAGSVFLQKKKQNSDTGRLLWESSHHNRGPLLSDELTAGLESPRSLNRSQQLPAGSIEQLQADVNTIKRAAENAAKAQEQSVIQESAQKVQQYANTDSEMRMAVKALDDNRQTTAQLPSATKTFLCITGFNLSRALRTFHVLSAVNWFYARIS